VDLWAEIQRLGASSIVILGGPKAVSVQVENALIAEMGEENVERIGGADRFDTADAVATRVVEVLGDGYDGTAFIATGGAFPDDLAASPLAAAQGWPVFLSGPDSVRDETLAAIGALGVTDLILLGGDAAVPPETDVTVMALGFSAVRIGGADRYETAAKVAAYGVDHAGLGWDRVGITTGANFPDALAGGVAQGKRGSVVLLTYPDSLADATRDALVANRAAITTVTFFGGSDAVATAVRDAVVGVLE
jgi:putative cell wall-binding protein